MAIRKQLSVFVENRPGMLANVCSTLSDAGVNVLAMSIHDTVDHAVLRLLCDNPTKALLLLEQEEYHVYEHQVVVVEIDNRPGMLAAVAKKLAESDINISYAYCTATGGQDGGALVLKTSEPERTEEVLRGL